MNLAASIGAGLIAIAILLYVANVVKSLRRGRKAEANPWRAETLEWAAQSPPPAYNFVRLPIVASRSPLWQEELGYVTGMPTDKRELLVTHALDAAPSHREEVPGPSGIPFTFSVILCLALIGSVFSPWWLIIGSLASIPPAIAWYWTEEKP
jgi:cytochrome c oxidase subunit 1